MLYYQRYLKLLNSLQSIFLLTIRTFWGWKFFQAGLGKYQNFENVVEFFTKLQIPAPQINVAIAASFEFFGGILLILGLGSRLITVPLITTMIVAYTTAHQTALLNVFSDPATFFKQEPFLFLYASLIVLIFGPGTFSVDWLITRIKGSSVGK